MGQFVAFCNSFQIECSIDIECIPVLCEWWDNPVHINGHLQNMLSKKSAKTPRQQNIMDLIVLSTCNVTVISLGC